MIARYHRLFERSFGGPVTAATQAVKSGLRHKMQPLAGEFTPRARRHCPAYSIAREGP